MAGLRSPATDPPRAVSAAEDRMIAPEPRRPGRLKRLAKKAYRALPFKRRLYEAVRAVWTPPARVFQHFHFEGPFTASFLGRTFTIVHAGTHIENTLFWEGVGNSWERVSLHVWARLAERADVVFDIGANTGVYAVIAAAMNERGNIHAFEPNPAFSRAIERASAINRFPIRLHAVALSDATGTLPFSGYMVDPSMAGSPLPSGWTAVPVTTLAHVMKAEGLERVDLIKCDVERHEPNVFAGMGPYLGACRPDILVEVLDDECASRLARVFAPLDYRYYEIDDDRERITPMAGLRKAADRNVLICRRETAERLERDRTLPWA